MKKIAIILILLMVLAVLVVGCGLVGQAYKINRTNQTNNSVDNTYPKECIQICGHCAGNEECCKRCTASQ